MNTPLFTDKVAEIFVKVDDFCNHFEHEFKNHALPAPAGIKKRNRKAALTDSEIITILITFHGGQFRNFKHFYLGYVCVHLRDCFPAVVSYNRFIELSHRSAVPFMLFLHYCCRGECTGISFIDSTVLRVCHNKRIKRNKVFKGMGNTSDNNAKIITRMTKELFGKMFGDKGYIGKALADLLFGDGIQLITAVRRNMKAKALSNEEKLLLRKRSVIETVNDELKNICQVEHTRHRSVAGFILNIISAIAAYSFFPKKPSIKNDITETNPVLIAQLNQPKLIAA